MLNLNMLTLWHNFVCGAMYEAAEFAHVRFCVMFQHLKQLFSPVLFARTERPFLQN
jgi:hypothetical protein